MPAARQDQALDVARVSPVVETTVEEGGPRLGRPDTLAEVE